MLTMLMMLINDTPAKITSDQEQEDILCCVRGVYLYIMYLEVYLAMIPPLPAIEVVRVNRV